MPELGECFANTRFILDDNFDGMVDVLIKDTQDCEGHSYSVIAICLYDHITVRWGLLGLFDEFFPVYFQPITQLLAKNTQF